MKNIIRSGRITRDGESSSLDQNIGQLPRTDWTFQTAAPSFRGGAGSFSGKSQGSFRAFRALGNSFFEAEGKREDRIEGIAFAVIVALSVWPMLQAAHALLHLIK